MMTTNSRSDQPPKKGDEEMSSQNPPKEPPKEPLEIRLKKAEKELRDNANRRRRKRAQAIMKIRDHRIGPC